MRWEGCKLTSRLRGSRRPVIVCHRALEIPVTVRRPLILMFTFVALAALPLYGQQNPEFDLLIRNGHVIDPKNGVDAVMDVAVAGGKIARVAAGINPALAKRVADATGLFVVPGLIDIHSHVFFGT